MAEAEAMATSFSISDNSQYTLKYRRNGIPTVYKCVCACVSLDLNVCKRWLFECIGTQSGICHYRLALLSILFFTIFQFRKFRLHLDYTYTYSYIRHLDT